ncbi:hypothetical protein [Algoriphagus namhaensis]
MPKARSVINESVKCHIIIRQRGEETTDDRCWMREDRRLKTGDRRRVLGDRCGMLGDGCPVMDAGRRETGEGRPKKDAG